MNADFLHAVLFYNLLYLPIWWIIRFLNFKIKKRINIKYEFTLYLFVAYLVSVAALTLIPLAFAENSPEGYINMRPLATEIYVISVARHNHGDISFLYENIYGNILMFTPFGFFIPILFPSKFLFFKIFIIALIGSSLIETIQWIEMHWHIHRIVDIDDVILNTLGACFGYGLFKSLNYMVNMTKLY